MRYLALATDFDDTLAEQGRVDPETVSALEQVRASGRYVILVTGRELNDLLRVFPRAEIFDRIVAENGAVLYQPASHEHRTLGEPPPQALLEALRARGIAPIDRGEVIVATSASHATTLLEAIRDVGLEHQVIFNKGSAMVLPPGVSKASGLRVAATELGLSLHNVVAVGDAENDQAMLSASECGVAVANALPMLRERADWVTGQPRGAGVRNLVDRLIQDDLSDLHISRHDILLGHRPDETAVEISAAGTSLLVAGTSGSGKSTLTNGVLERLTERGYQFCVVDPEGDYDKLAGAVVIGDAEHAPTIQAALDVLDKPNQQLVVNLLGIQLERRPEFFDALLSRLQELRARTGRPHWIVIDEAHHLLPGAWRPAPLTVPEELSGLILITVHPDHVAPIALRRVDAVVAVGEGPGQTLADFARSIDLTLPPAVYDSPGAGWVWTWWLKEHAPFRMRIEPPRQERRRHLRKYAEGDLGPDQSFYFRGRDGALHLQAQNLRLFLQIGDGVDDATWCFHLERGDYAAWIRQVIKDEVLAAEVETISGAQQLSANESRRRVRAAIERRYTMSA